MQRKIFATSALALMLAWSATAWAALCPKCRDLMFVDSTGKCTGCGSATASGALKLCPKCSVSQHKCEHCQAKIDAADIAADASRSAPPAEKPAPAEKPPVEKPATQDPAPAEKPPAELPSAQGIPIEKLPEAKPPTTPSTTPSTAPSNATPPASSPTETPQPIDQTKSGAYTSGRWQFRLDIVEPGTRSEGRWGWLWYDGQKLPRGEVNDYYRTPWGPIYWVDVPKTYWGMHGWMPVPLAQNPRQGHALAVPTTAAPRSQAGQSATAPAQTSQPPYSPQSAKPQSLELTRADNGKRARVRVGNIIVIRLPGNPTTGYQWQATQSSPVVRLVGKPQYAPNAQQRPNTVGGGGTFVFTYQVVQPGTGAIRLVYTRPWERNVAPVESFAVGVDVLSSPGAGRGRPYGATAPTGPTRPVANPGGYGSR